MSATAQRETATPAPANLSKPVVSKFASDLADKLRYHTAADLERIVQELGGVIRYESYGLDDSGGSLEVYPEEKLGFVIKLYSFVGTLRNRFTIAHELGHYFLHSDLGQKPISVNRAGSGRVEWEANWFASAFLLPEKRFRDDWERFGHSVTRIASVYQVSEPVVEIRLETLGLRGK